MLALKLFINTNIDNMSNRASINKSFYTEEIVAYLEKRVPSSGSIGLSESIINEYRNHYLKILINGIKDIVNAYFSNANSCFQVTDLYDIYGSINGARGKAEKIVEYTIAAVEGIFLIYENEFAGRYEYFQSYLSNRGNYSSKDDQIFQTIMSYNRMACTDNNWLAGFLDIFSFITNKDSFSNHFDVMDEWAEFTYQFGVYVDSKNELSSVDGGTDAIEYEVNSIKFVASSYSLFMNGTLTNPATAYPTNAANRTITYSSGNTSIATIDSSGKVTPVNYGTVTIYASTSNGTTASYNLTIVPYYATEISSDSVEITRYLGNSSTVTIPESIQGYTIKSIGENAFRSCTSVTKINIPDSITNIGYGAFYDCENLASINIPDSVTNIGTRAFFECYSLISINIPDSVTNIGEEAFAYCPSLTSVTIPGSVTSIGDYAFERCISLENVYITDIKAWLNIDFNNSYSNPMNNAVKLYLNNELVTDLIIPDGITSIGRYAFVGCRSLTSMTIPDSVTIIGDYAFDDCSNLTSINIPDSVTSIGNYAFYNCNSLTSITIPDNITNIGIGAFNGCSKLTDINIPNSVTSIGGYAFYNCSSLTNINIPDTVTSINSYTFSGCSSLTSINISNGVTSIGDYAFSNCISLTGINIPNNVTSISTSAFEYCTKLKDINVSLDNEKYTSADGILFNKLKTTIIRYPIGKTNAFYSIPTGVINIGDSAFRDCTNLKSISLPDSVIGIDNFAFFGCRNLTNITIGNSVKSISGAAFCNCTSLSNVIIPDSVKYINNSAFTNCDNLTIYCYFGNVSDVFSSTDYVYKCFGDFDDDKNLNAIDMLYMRKVIFGDLVDEYDEKIADINQDDSFDARDLVRLKKKLAGVI